MSWSKIHTMAAVIVFVFGIATIDSAVAGEKQKIKAHGAQFTVKSHQIEVGDDEGHVIVIWENATIYFSEITGERSTQRGVGFADINPKTGEMFGQGYGVGTDKDGDKTMSIWEGKPAAEKQWKGTWKYKKGTGKYEGIKGGGTWASYSLGPEQSSVEVEGEMETP
ncbi:MAG: hypothetical protein JSW26_31235 [Desulfobacterales bacterium]|nr:MAG: hypothetical protein JSW26_31235 [Desulfobacterales bacterium]